ncbi:hypothetical protein BDK51DRAFT_27130, partial [Blyttiomyces helicus]
AWSSYFKENINTKDAYPELNDLTLDTTEPRLKAVQHTYKKIHDICEATSGGGLEDMQERHKMSKPVYERYAELMHDNPATHTEGRSEGPGDDTPESREKNPFFSDKDPYSDEDESTSGGSDSNDSDAENNDRGSARTPATRSSTPVAGSSAEPKPKPPGALCPRKEPLDKRVKNEVGRALEVGEQGFNTMMVFQAQVQQRWEEMEARREEERREREERRMAEEREERRKEERRREWEERREERRESQANVFQMGMLMMMSKMCGQSVDMGMLSGGLGGGASRRSSEEER